MKALFIDFDGTLVDSIPALYQTYETFLHSLGLKGSKEEFHSLLGLTFDEIKAKIEKKRGISFKEEQLLSLYREGIEQKTPQLFPFAKEVLTYAKSKGLLIYIVTSAKRFIVQKIIEKESLEDLIDAIVTAEGLFAGKPSPEIYLKALKMAGVKKEEVLVIEDAENGVQAALAAGLAVFVFDPISRNWKDVLKEIKFPKN